MKKHYSNKWITVEYNFDIPDYFLRNNALYSTEFENLLSDIESLFIYCSAKLSQGQWININFQSSEYKDEWVNQIEEIIRKHVKLLK